MKAENFNLATHTAKIHQSFVFISRTKNDKNDKIQIKRKKNIFNKIKNAYHSCKSLQLIVIITDKIEKKRKRIKTHTFDEK